jgi:tRNA-binding protein
MNSEEFKVASVKPPISFAELGKIDIRVGTIAAVEEVAGSDKLVVEEVAGSDKLVRLVVDFGDHRRNILAGIKQERDSPKSIEGRQALFVVNLEPKKMMGELSEGMLFDIGYADGIEPVLAVPESMVPNGTRAG